MIKKACLLLFFSCCSRQKKTKKKESCFFSFAAFFVLSKICVYKNGCVFGCIFLSQNLYLTTNKKVHQKYLSTHDHHAHTKHVRELKTRKRRVRCVRSSASWGVDVRARRRRRTRAF